MALEAPWSIYLAGWDFVQPLSPHECDVLVKEFASVCVVPDFRKKFLREVGRYSVIGKRYFGSHTYVAPTRMIREAIPNVQWPSTIEVVYYITSKPNGFRLMGHPVQLKEILVEECDVIARIPGSSGETFIFYCGSTLEGFRFTLAKETDR